ncbi:hypothetical protein BJV74DRAFT_798078 [Russula compacta]|nr:hypothetical protein BJV74DRAFT_798078 [Russula compacta]
MMFRIFWVTSVTASGICVILGVFLACPLQTEAELPVNARIHWTTSNETTLIQVLHENISEMASNKMFKDMVYKTVVIEEDVYDCYCTEVKVRPHIWDNEKGMNDDPVKNNPEFKLFANKGWPHYEHMALFIPSMAKGTHAHQGTQLVEQLPSTQLGSSSSSTQFDTMSASSPYTSESNKCKAIHPSFPSSSH